MRVAAIELFVDLTVLAEKPTIAVRQTLVQNARRRNEQALSAIRAALQQSPDVIMCPGWTFVGDDPPKGLPELVGKTTLIFEVLPKEEVPVSSTDTGKGKSSLKRQEESGTDVFPWRTFVVEAGRLREVPRQVIAEGAEVSANAKALASALMDGKRHVAGGRLFICGETNVLRIRRKPQTHYVWDAEVALGAPEAAFAGKTIFNPAHTPSGPRMYAKRQNGPWRALITTANQFDREWLGLGGALPQPTCAFVEQQSITWVTSEPVKAGSKDLVTVFELP